MGKIKYIVKENKLLAFATFTLVVLELLLIFWQNKYISEQINVMKEQNTFIVKQNTFIEQQTKIMKEQNNINRNVLKEMAIQNKYISEQSNREAARFSQEQKALNQKIKQDKIKCLESFLNKIEPITKYQLERRNKIVNALNDLKNRGFFINYDADQIITNCGLK